MHKLEIFFVILTVLVNIFLGLLVWKSDKKSLSNKFFSMITLIISSWAIANYFSLNSRNPDMTLFWIRMVMFITTPLAPVLYLFTRSFPRNEENISLGLKVLIIFECLLLFSLAFTPFMFSGVSIIKGIKPVPGIGIFIYGIFASGFLIASAIDIVRKYKKYSGVLKMQLKFLIAGLLITFSLMLLTNFLVVIILKYSNFVVFGPPFSIILIGFTAYAIVKHRLLDIKVFATELLTVVLSMILLSKLLLFKNTTDFILDIFVFSLVLVFSYLLIKSVRREIEQKEKLQELTEKLKALDKQKDEFVSMAAHELRAPMTAIKGYLSMIAEGDTGKLSEETANFLNDAMEGNERLIRLVNSMLNLSRIEEGRLVYQITDFSLNELANIAYKEYIGEAGGKTLRFNIESAKNLRDKVRADKDQVHEVIVNLISNAIKYTDKGSVEVKLLNPKKDLIRLEVIDTGRGVSKEEQEKLFKKFIRIASSTGKTIGSGLGLYISKLLVEKFGGEIGVISIPDKGSTFWFELPLIK